MTSAVKFKQVSKYFDSVCAVDNVDLSVTAGEFFAMLGPSGSGKTTCLRLIAGFEQPGAGSIHIFDQDCGGVPPYKREVNTVFQDYALFPHMSVAENIAYSLMIKKVGKSQRRAEAEKALEMVRLGGLADRKPSQLSGGQRQRVALARALVNKPKVLLLDEPLGALDLKLREDMQEELKTIQQSLGITFIFVTHDQGEALSMADRVAVFDQGKIVQTGTPQDVYHRPRNNFVASFVGSSNILPSSFVQKLTGTASAASLRPEAIRLVANNDGGAGLTATISGISFQGASTRLNLDIKNPDTRDVPVRALVANDQSAALKTGQHVSITWDPDAIHLMETDGE